MTDFYWLIFVLVIGICFYGLGHVLGRLLEHSKWAKLVEQGKLPKPGIEETLWTSLKTYMDQYDWMLTVSNEDYELINITGKALEKRNEVQEPRPIRTD